MKVFELFFRVLKKHLVTTIIYIVVFLFISVQFVKNEDKQLSFEETKLDIVVFDEDDTDASRSLKEFIGKKHDLGELDRRDDAILDALYYEEYDAAIVIKKGYSEALAAGRTGGLFESYHVHDSYAEVLVKNLLGEYVSTVKAYLAGGSDFEAAIDKTGAVLTEGAEVKMLEDEDEGSSEYSEDFGVYFQYLAYILISVMISALGPVLIVLQKKDNRERTICSGISPTGRILQIYLGTSVFVVAVWLIFMAAGAVINGGMYEGRAWMAVLNSLVYSLISAGIAILLAAFDLKDQALSLLTQIIGLGMSFLCGVFVPQSFLGDGVLKFAHILPAYWYVRANNVLVGTEVAYSASEVYKCIGIEVGFMVALFTAAVIVARRRRR
ncbi:MAG: ABC transporter permease [Ruminococcus sp.]|nr:ABC transporter permease [Ruminococcus sp.]